MKQNLEISNGTLIEECRKGDKEALNLFYLRFAPRMLSVIHRYIRDRKDAEDVLHDGFIVAFTRLDSLRDADKADIWLAMIMKNLSLRFLQDQDMAQILHEIPDVEDTPEIDEILDLATLETLIAKLPAGYQKVFRLAVLENKSHKEIGKLLGIAPNSSSSQLFHAKLMMRKLINEYKLQAAMCVMLIGMLLGGLFIGDRKPALIDNPEILIANIGDEEIIETASDSAYHPVNKIVSSAVARTVKAEITPVENVEIESSEETETIASADTTRTVEPKPVIKDDTFLADADTEDNPLPEPLYIKGASGGWSFNVGADPGLLSFNNPSLGDYSYDSPGNNLGNGPGSNSPEDPDDRENEGNAKNAAPMLRDVFGYNDYRNVSHTNSLPVSAAFTVSKAFGDVFSIESGVRYTYLHSRFETATSVADCHWHYVGIPLKVNVKVYSSHRFRFYIGAGGAVDFPLHSNAEVSTTFARPDLHPGRFSSPVTWSLQGNLGVSIKLSKKVDLFLEPTLHYYFDTDYTVPNAWTDNPWSLSLPLGLRLNF